MTPEERKAHKRNYYLQKRDYYIQKALETYRANRTEILEKRKAYQEQKKDYLKEYNKQYYHKKKSIVKPNDDTNDKVKEKKTKEKEIIESPTIELIEKVVILEPMNVSFYIDW